ncbi:MAG: polysaccharide deacetylase family protein, partial [Promethearchaeota archaeon]
MRNKQWVLPIIILVLSTGSIFISGTGLDEVTLAEPTTEVFRGGKQFAFMFSWDDGGNDLNFSFLEDSLDFRHTTFGVTRRLLVNRLWGLDQLFRGHDIQSHSREHLHHAILNESYREYLISQSVLDINEAYGYIPILFAYPYGSQNADCQRQVLKYFKVARGIYFETSS